MRIRRKSLLELAEISKHIAIIKPYAKNINVTKNLQLDLKDVYRMKECSFNPKFSFYTDFILTTNLFNLLTLTSIHIQVG